MAWNTLRTLVNRAGVAYDALKTSVIFAEDMNKIKGNEEYLKNAIENAFSAWNPLGAVIYEGADAPSYTISFASDMTAILNLGARIKLTDSTVKYFIITKIGAYTGGKTIITLYGGTDYTLSGGVITSFYYSQLKAPFGFPLSPLKWTEKLVMTSDVTTPNPVQMTWYNITSKAIPIGIWNITWGGVIGVVSNADKTIVRISGTLSTANNTESDTELSVYQGMTGASSVLVCIAMVSVSKTIELNSKTTYYLNYRTISASENIASIVTAYAHAPLKINAVCAYL